jgi:NTE family protein
MVLPHFTKLVLGGGGVRGFAFLGALKRLAEIQPLDTFQHITGSSIGALIGLLVLLNYSIDEMINDCIEIELVSPSPPPPPPLTPSSQTPPLPLLETFGFDSGDFALDKIKQLIRKKTRNANITFQKLYELYPIRFDIVTVCVNDKATCIFNYLNTPDVLVYTAIRMSMSVPILFCPVNYNGKLYIDGGILDNFPVNPGGKDTIAFRIAEEKENSSDESTVSKINDIQTYITTIVYCVLSELEKLKIRYQVASDTTIVNIEIPRNAPSAFYIQISKNDKKQFIKLGYTATFAVLGPE